MICFQRRTKKLSFQSGSDDSTIASDVSEDLERPPLHVFTKKSVSFAPTAAAKYTLSRKAYSPAEKQAAWFCREEFDEITTACCKQVEKIERGEIFKDTKYCARGLESYTRSAAKLKLHSRQAAYAAVLDGQAGSLDDEKKISKAYKNVSFSCQLWARVVGLRDQKAAESYPFDVEIG
jgi:hypothetical protein